MKRTLPAVLLLLSLCACGPKTLVVLIPDDDGHVGKVSVATSKESLLLNTADESVVVSEGIGKPKILDQKAIEKDFGSALAAAPGKPVSYLLYFKTDAPEPDAASLKLIPGIAEAIKGRDVARVTIIGHTDAMGDRQFNDKLSLSRAESVRNLLLRAGVDPAIIRIHGFGPNDPLVPNVPGKGEPQNRRVEAFIR